MLLMCAIVCRSTIQKFVRIQAHDFVNSIESRQSICLNFYVDMPMYPQHDHQCELKDVNCLYANRRKRIVLSLLL